MKYPKQKQKRNLSNFKPVDIIEGETDNEQAMNAYNAMEEEGEMDNYNEMQQ